ncbi:hypothetical protein CUR178_06056 [Leishmania enriettii]|uniref:Uncharacterized protein n=1 Tax=Leishmania enriettii TaxID=5663 RepID=A0A836KQV0_LEIEN|nr:hypothetical protein CUR178_06056 [Leishmania enriettii]
MSFSTKFAMWWGSVTTKTEMLFNKEKQRLVTHEYYDNPNPKSARPRSMHSIRGSMRVAGSDRGFQATDNNENCTKSFRQGNRTPSEGDVEETMGGIDPGYGSVQQRQYSPDQQYMQSAQYMHQHQYQGYPSQAHGQVY